jgi:MFS superfamily sulfate permease-like transporter
MSLGQFKGLFGYGARALPAVCHALRYALLRCAALRCVRCAVLRCAALRARAALCAALRPVADPCLAARCVLKHRQPNFDASQEYVALGIANFFGSFTGSYPISGSFSRSALNDEVGATSPVSVLVVGGLVGLILKIASEAPIFFYLPQNALSAIVIVALTNLMDIDHFRWLCKHDRKDAALWVTAFLAVLAVPGHRDRHFDCRDSLVGFGGH